MDSNASVPSRKRRHSKACTRCRKRKIRCDFQFPSCGACSTAGATCLGFDSIHGLDKPRSTISHLENEVARLETELGRFENRTKSMSDVADAAVERLTTRLATTIIDPRSRPPKQESLLPLTSNFFLSGSPVPYLSSKAWDDTKAEQSEAYPLRAIAISSIPRHVIDIMLRNYCEKYRPRYPAIRESDLYEACDRVYNNAQPSDFDIFCTYITLSISTNTLMYHDEKRAKIASYGFWSTALVHLDQIGLASSWERLQALQLLTHYGFLNPTYVDCGKCAAAATRLCLQLGLHHELPASAQMKLDTATLNTRRRLFWNSYSNDSAIHTARCRPFIWPTTAFTAKFPDDDSQSAPGIHVWELRRIESEITMALYYTPLGHEDPSSNNSFDECFTRMHDRLNEWHQLTRQSVNLSEKIEFHELFFHVQMLRLNRPSPRCPNPTMEMRKKALKSSIALIKEFSVIDRLGKLFNLWHASYCIVEAGICLLASVLIGVESIGQDYTHLEGEDVTILTRYMKTFTFLLWRVSSRWSNIAQHASTLETISLSILEKLQQWSRGKIIESSDSQALKQKLNQVSLFSPLPLESQPAVEEFVLPQVISYGNMEGASRFNNIPTHPGIEDSHETTGNELSPALEGTTASVGPYRSFDASNFQVSTTEAAFFDAPFNPDWVGPQLHTQDGSSIFPDPYGIDGGDTLQWGFSGMDSEEIFVALLEGGEIPILNDFLTGDNLALQS